MNHCPVLSQKQLETSAASEIVWILVASKIGGDFAKHQISKGPILSMFAIYLEQQVSGI